MSTRALFWAMEQDSVSSSQKFVLLALCNHCNEKGQSYPGIQTVCRFTLLHEDTVARSLEVLIQAGLIVDTGETRGTTGRTKVYQLPEDCIEKPRTMRVLNTSEIPVQSPHNPRTIPASCAAPNIKEPRTKNLEPRNDVSPELQEARALWIQAFNESNPDKYVAVTKRRQREDAAAINALLESGMKPQGIYEKVKLAFQTRNNRPKDKDFWACNHIDSIHFFAERIMTINAEIAKDNEHGRPMTPEEKDLKAYNDQIIEDAFGPSKISPKI